MQRDPVRFGRATNASKEFAATIFTVKRTCSCETGDSHTGLANDSDLLLYFAVLLCDRVVK